MTQIASYKLVFVAKYFLLDPVIHYPIGLHNSLQNDLEQRTLTKSKYFLFTKFLIGIIYDKAN